MKNKHIEDFTKTNVRLKYAMNAALKALQEFNKAYDKLPAEIKDFIKDDKLNLMNE